MSLTELWQQEQARQGRVSELRDVRDAAKLDYDAARNRLAHATRKNKPEVVLQPLRAEAHEKLITLQRARRALIKAL